MTRGLVMRQTNNNEVVQCNIQQEMKQETRLEKGIGKAYW